MKFLTSVRFITTYVAALGLVCAQTPAVKKAPPSKPLASKTTPAKKVAAAKGAHGKAPVKRAAVQPRQASPTPDRYKEIQSALAAKGYLKSEPSGVWDAQSVDAMKRYQVDHKQDPSGKLTAASIIGLGLGAHTAESGVPNPAPAQHP
jgi:hypothetical protein